jgi:GT2 family glycosyltransferase
VDLSVIIVSWNVREYLHRCIESILETKGSLSTEIVVVDNASLDGSAEMVRAEFREAKLISSETNLGFARANNLGLADARGSYVFFLNPDTVVGEGALIRMVDFLDREPDFAVVGPRLMDPSGGIQPECARTLPTITLTLFDALYLHRLPFIGSRVRNHLISPYDLDEQQEVEALSGAAMLGRREIIQQLGGFDEIFLHTGEDVDLCLRLKQNGFRIFYLADAEIVHFGGQSAALASVRAESMGFLSMHEYFKRSRGRLHAELYRLIVQGIRMPLLLLVGLGKAFVSRDAAGLRERCRLAKATWERRVAD